MSQDPLKYLQQDNIGKVIAKGLANVYNNKPERPIKYLAQWLKSYSNNKKQLSKVIDLQTQKQKNKIIYQQNKKLVGLKEQEEVTKNKLRNDKIKEFQHMIEQHQYQEQLLEEVFPEFIEKFTEITGAYVGQLNYPPKHITEQDTDQTAHINTKVDKVINYIGSSISHKNLMRGKILKLTQGITSKAFQLAQQQSPPILNQQGQQQPKQPKQKYIYIPNVVKSQSIHYFRIPKLGAYLGVPMICKSYLKQKTFDQVLEQKKKQLNQQQQFNKKKQQQLQQLNHTKQQLKKKINEGKQKHMDQAQLQTFNTQLTQLDNKIQDKQKQQYEFQEINPNFIKNSYVICVDNLGKDKQLNSTDIQLVTKLVQHFKISWQNKQKQLLFKDIKTQIDFLHDLPSPPAAIKPQFQRLTQIDQQSLKNINQIQDQFLRAYKTQQFEFQRKKQQLKSNKIYLSSFLKLKQFRVVKYKQVIQNILYFLGYTKDKTNIPNQAVLNWKYVKDHFITKQIFDSILNYIVHGPKQKQFKFYSKITALEQIFQKVNEDQIFGYNIGLGGIVKFIKKTLKHRISNIKLRKAQKQAERIKRKQLIDQNTAIDLQKEQELKQIKEKLLPQQVEGFKEEQWITKFEKQHPKNQVPAEIVDDIDNDV